MTKCRPSSKLWKSKICQINTEVTEIIHNNTNCLFDLSVWNFQHICHSRISPCPGTADGFVGRQRDGVGYGLLSGQTDLAIKQIRHSAAAIYNCLGSIVPKCHTVATLWAGGWKKKWEQWSRAKTKPQRKRKRMKGQRGEGVRNGLNGTDWEKLVSKKKRARGELLWRWRTFWKEGWGWRYDDLKIWMEKGSWLALLFSHLKPSLSLSDGHIFATFYIPLTGWAVL